MGHFEFVASLHPDRPKSPEPFVCVICEQHQENRWPGSVQTWPIEPICYYCETLWGLKNLQSVGTSGTHRDRRYANQIKALAEKLNAEAWAQKHKKEGYFGNPA